MECKKEVNNCVPNAGTPPVSIDVSLAPAAIARQVRVVKRTKEARIKVGMGNTMFWRIQNPNDPLYDKDFPLSFSILGGRARGYFECELDAWLERRASMDPRRKLKIETADRDETCALPGGMATDKPFVADHRSKRSISRNVKAAVRKEGT